MLGICSIASGSSGNCIYIGNHNTHLLIDTGISGKKIENGLKAIDVNPKELSGILITHEHSDHISGLGVMARRYKLPIYTTAKTWQEISAVKSVGNIDMHLFNEIKPDEPFAINDIIVNPFSTSHDASDSVCYTFSYHQKKISVATDLGCYDDYIIEKLKHSNVLFIEANHDVRMLEVGSYPYFLKQRILSDLGHLSNENSAKLILDLCHEELSYVILGHLSRENNHPSLAYESINLELKSNIHYNSSINLSVAKRNEHSDLIMI
jgi:phosphoribosyl 1,2-cyclic phosphodiesterase